MSQDNTQPAPPLLAAQQQQQANSSTVPAALSNPVLKQPVLDELDQKLLEAAAIADRGEDLPDELAKELKIESAEPSKTDKSAEEKGDDRPRDPITGKFLKKEGQTTQAEGEISAPDGQQTAPESEYAKKQREKKEKEQARLDKTWENVNRQKEELEQRRKELEEYEKQLKTPAQPRQQRQYSSQQLYDASLDFKNRAKQALAKYKETADDRFLDEFNEQDRLADEAFKSAGQFYQIERQEAQQEQFQKYNESWKGVCAKAMETEPELADPESDISKAVNALLETDGQVFYQIPDGFNKCVEVAKLRLKADGYDEILEANKKLKAENDRLTALSTPSRSGPAGAPTAKTWESMSSKEQDDYLKRQAEEWDKAHGIHQN